MNKKRYIVGLALIASGVALGVVVPFWSLPHPGNYAAVVLLIAASVLVIAGLGISAGELARSIVKRLKESRERNKAKRDRQRQARQNKPGSTFR